MNQFRKILENQVKEQLEESIVQEQVSEVSIQEANKPKRESAKTLKSITDKIRDNLIKIKKEEPTKNGIIIYFFNNDSRDLAEQLFSNEQIKEDKKLTFIIV